MRMPIRAGVQSIRCKKRVWNPNIAGICAGKLFSSFFENSPERFDLLRTCHALSLLLPMAITVHWRVCACVCVCVCVCAHIYTYVYLYICIYNVYNFSCTVIAITFQKSPTFLQRIHTFQSKEPYVPSKEPHISEEPFIPSKEAYIFKEPYIPSNEPHIPIKRARYSIKRALHFKRALYAFQKSHTFHSQEPNIESK